MTCFCVGENQPTHPPPPDTNIYFPIDFTSFSEKQGADMESFEIDESSSDPPAWYLQQKMDNARKKLEGYNPAFLTETELKMGHNGKPYLDSVCKIAKGDPNLNTRAQHGEICPSVQAQVECLIDMATDPDILGRCWSGWHSWI